VSKKTEEFCQSNNGALLGKSKTRCIDMLQHVSEILDRKRGDGAGLKMGKSKDYLLCDVSERVPRVGNAFNVLFL